jgi:hypothetical protein
MTFDSPCSFFIRKAKKDFNIYDLGPIPLPLFGNTLTLGTKNTPYDIFLKWKEQYGSVYTYWLGEKPIVSLASFDTIRETILKDGDAYTGTEFFPEWQKEFLGKIFIIY